MVYKRLDAQNILKVLNSRNNIYIKWCCILIIPNSKFFKYYKHVVTCDWQKELIYFSI